MTTGDLDDATRAEVETLLAEADTHFRRAVWLGLTCEVVGLAVAVLVAWLVS